MNESVVRESVTSMWMAHTVRQVKITAYCLSVLLLPFLTKKGPKKSTLVLVKVGWSEHTLLFGRSDISCCTTGAWYLRHFIQSPMTLRTVLLPLIIQYLSLSEHKTCWRPEWPTSSWQSLTINSVMWCLLGRITGRLLSYSRGVSSSLPLTWSSPLCKNGLNLMIELFFVQTTSPWTFFYPFCSHHYSFLTFQFPP